MTDKRKELKREYKRDLTQMGVFQIRNTVNEKVFVGSSLNLPGIKNRHEFQLKMGGHPNKRLQAEYNEFGSDKFVFEILEELLPRTEPNYDYRADLTFLEDLWLEKLEPYGECGYNEKKKTRFEKLSLISARRLENL